MPNESDGEETPLLTTFFPNPDLSQPTSPTSLSSWMALDRQELWKHFRIRLRYYIPIFGWLPKYEFEQLQGDIMAGLTVAFLIIPQSLSYAQALVNVPPLIGLYSAFIPQIVYAILGTSR